MIGYANCNTIIKLTHPIVYNVYNWHLDTNLYCLLFLYTYDNLIAKRMKGRWFNVHAIGNLIVSLSSLRAVVAALNDPINALNTSMWKVGTVTSVTSVLPVCMINAIHLYHMLAFSNLTPQDYFHHLLFIPCIGVPCQIFSSRAGVLGSYSCFFLSGFPGGVDYFLLFLMKNKYIEKIKEKQWNVFLNKWIRNPFILFSSFMQYIGYRYGFFDNKIILLTMVLTAYNCIHYNAQSVENYTFHKLVQQWTSSNTGVM